MSNLLRATTCKQDSVNSDNVYESNANQLHHLL